MKTRQKVVKSRYFEAPGLAAADEVLELTPNLAYLAFKWGDLITHCMMYVSDYTGLYQFHTAD